MDPAEQIVTLWLYQQGYFTMNEIKASHGKEIDILAMHPQTGHKRHVEVTVSIIPVGELRAQSPARCSGSPRNERIRDFYRKKFVGKNSCVERKVKEYFETAEYEKILVVGNLGKDNPIEVEEELRKYRVKMVLLEDILKQVVEKMKKEKKVYMDSNGRYIQILSTFLKPPEAKERASLTYSSSL
jgi:hypothetical protein